MAISGSANSEQCRNITDAKLDADTTNHTSAHLSDITDLHALSKIGCLLWWMRVSPTLHRTEREKYAEYRTTVIGGLAGDLGVRRRATDGFFATPLKTCL